MAFLLPVTWDASVATSVAAPTPRSVRIWIFSVWFDHDLFAVNIGGGKINHPGRYLVLLPPINGATAASGTPYFTENPGDPFKAWDMCETRSAICPANTLPSVGNTTIAPQTCRTSAIRAVSHRRAATKALPDRLCRALHRTCAKTKTGLTWPSSLSSDLRYVPVDGRPRRGLDGEYELW